MEYKLMKRLYELSANLPENIVSMKFKSKKIKFPNFYKN